MTNINTPPLSMQVSRSLKLLIGLTVCSSSVSFAQKKISQTDDVEVFAGKSEKRKPGQTIEYFSNVTDTTFEVVLGSKTDFTYDTYNDKLEVVNSRTELLKQQPDYGKNYTLVQMKGQDYLLKAVSDEKAKRNEVLLSQLDALGKEIGETRKLTEIEGDGFYKDMGNAYLSYTTSDDESLILVYLKLAESRSSDDLPVQNFRFIVFDETMKLLWQKDVAFDLSKGKTRVGNATWLFSSNENAIKLKNDGTINVWASVDRGREFDKANRFQTDIYSISSESVFHKTLAKVNPRRWTMDTQEGGLKMISLSEIKGFDLFGIVLKPSGNDAIHVVNWDGTRANEPKFVTIPFRAEHLSRNQTAKTRSKAKKAEAKGKPVLIPNYGIDEIIILPDSSLLIAGQQQYSVTTVSKSGLTSRTKYYNKDIHLFNISIDGKVNWTYNIPMFQYTSGAGQGYVLKVFDEKVYVIFNDNFKNHEKSWDTSKKPAKFSSIDNPVTLVSFNMSETEEKQVRQLLWKSKSAGGLFEPEKFYSPAGKNMGLVYIQGGKLKSNLLKLNFQ